MKIRIAHERPKWKSVCTGNAPISKRRGHPASTETWGPSVRYSEAVPLPGPSPSQVHPLRPWDEWRTLGRAKSLSLLNVPFRF